MNLTVKHVYTNSYDIYNGNKRIGSADIPKDEWYLKITIDHVTIGKVMHVDSISDKVREWIENNKKDVQEIELEVYRLQKDIETMGSSVGKSILGKELGKLMANKEVVRRTLERIMKEVE